jgi:hypothetical protein
MRLARVLLVLALVGAPALAQQATNAFNDPFLQATSAIPNCPTPAGPLYTPDEVRAEAHVRAQHGTSCYRSGRCRLPNSYLYDAEIAPRVVQFLRQDERFANSSVWVIGRQRLVFLLGCAASREQAAEMERSVGLVDDVMGVVNWLSLPGQAPTYTVAPAR